jgi:uncharacterized membrane protein
VATVIHRAFSRFTFFVLTFTPSLVPRPPIFQGLLGGVSFFIGYAIGHSSVLLWRFLQGAANILGMAIERDRHERSLKAALVRHQFLLKEINHRVKNSLMIVASPDCCPFRKSYPDVLIP